MNNNNPAQAVLFTLMLFPSAAFACGREGIAPQDVALMGVALIIFLCSLSIPVAGLLSNDSVSPKVIKQACLLSISGVVGSILTFFATANLYVHSLVLFTLALSMFTPSAYYLYYAVKRRQQTSSYRQG